jgi:hypothetical protein
MGSKKLSLTEVSRGHTGEKNLGPFLTGFLISFVGPEGRRAEAFSGESLPEEEKKGRIFLYPMSIFASFKVEG